MKKISKRKVNEQMKFDDDSRPHPDVERDLSAKNTSFKDVELPQTDDQETGSYEELLSSEQYKNALEKLSLYTNTRNIGVGMSPKYGQLSMQAMQILNEIIRAEANHKEELEELCVELIKDYFDIPEDALQYDFKITGAPINVRPKMSKQQLQQKEEQLTQEIGDLSPERSKRRLINSMIQGHAVDGTYIYNRIRPQIEGITGVRNITDKYSILASVMMLGYWQYPNAALDAQMGGEDSDGKGAGKTEVILTTDPPTIKAESMVFPFLIHEAIKGVMEYLSTQKEPTEGETKAKELEDHVVHEIWDIRIGPAIWRRLLQNFPDAVMEDDNEKKMQYYLYQELVNTPAKEFLLSMKEILQKSEIGKKLISAMYYDIKTILDGEVDDEAETQYRRVMDELLKNTDDDFDVNIDDFLSELGLSVE
jgi:hypothetical protein